MSRRHAIHMFNAQARAIIALTSGTDYTSAGGFNLSFGSATTPTDAQDPNGYHWNRFSTNVAATSVVDKTGTDVGYTVALANADNFQGGANVNLPADGHIGGIPIQAYKGWLQDNDSAPGVVITCAGLPANQAVSVITTFCPASNLSSANGMFSVTSTPTTAEEEFVRIWAAEDLVAENLLVLAATTTAAGGLTLNQRPSRAGGYTSGLNFISVNW